MPNDPAMFSDMARDRLIPFAIGCVTGHNGSIYKPASFHRDIAAALERVARGETKRLAISMPPQHGKSTLAGVAFPAWYLGQNPSHHVITSSYGYSLSQGFSRQIRHILGGNNFRGVFPDVQISPEQKAVHEWRTTKGGGLHVAGYKGGHSGHPCDGFVFDDPYQGWTDARSDATREQVNFFYDSVLLPRLSARGWIVIIHTRWREDDLIGRLTSGPDQHPDLPPWTVLSFPALDAQGKYLWGEYYPAWHYQERREKLGPALWNALYQQDPTPIEGNIFKSGWWAHYNGARPAFRRVVQSWDTAFSEKTSADYSCCVTFADTGKDYWLIDVWRGRIDFPELIRRSKLQAEKHNPSIILIEEKASGISLIQTLRRETQLPIRGVKAETDKESRAVAVSGYVESGRVKLPGDAPWLPEFLNEMARFPNGKHDDQVDAFVHGLGYITKPGMQFG